MPNAQEADFWLRRAHAMELDGKDLVSLPLPVAAPSAPSCKYGTVSARMRGYACNLRVLTFNKIVAPHSLTENCGIIHSQ